MQFATRATLLALVGAAAVNAQGIPDYGPAGSVARVVSTDTVPVPALTSSASGTNLPPPATVKSFDWASASSAAVSAVANRTASSNYTLPVPTATATWPANFIKQESKQFVMQQLNTQDLPELGDYDLSQESEIRREVICGQQTKFCATAGCVEEGATIKDNFCNVKTLGSKCTCTKGLSNLAQWKWPVQFNDCLGRSTTCADKCLLPGATTVDRTACRAACQANFASTCGSPGQYSANYAVAKQGDKPSLSMMQGGEASSAAALRTSAAVVAAMAALAALALAA